MSKDKDDFNPGRDFAIVIISTSTVVGIILFVICTLSDRRLEAQYQALKKDVESHGSIAEISQVREIWRSIQVNKYEKHNENRLYVTCTFPDGYYVYFELDETYPILPKEGETWKVGVEKTFRVKYRLIERIKNP